MQSNDGRFMPGTSSLLAEMPVWSHARQRGSLLEVTPDVACIQLAIVNLFLVGERGSGDRSWVLVDGGLSYATDRVRRAVAEWFGPDSRPAAIVLTHGHLDHVGVLPQLAQLWDVPVYAHPLEIPYLTGQSSYPPPDPAVGGGAMSFLSRLYPRGPINLGNRVQPLPADGSVPGMPRWRWIATPGHTPGHVALYREADGTLIAGDAFVTVKQESAIDVMLTHQPHVRRPPAYYTQDWQAARRSVAELARLRPNVAVTGHGLPMYGERLRRQLDELVRDWDRLALPPQGRYIRQPAMANQRGTVSVPPPVFDPQLIAAAGIGLAILTGAMMLVGRRTADSQDETDCD